MTTIDPNDRRHEVRRNDAGDEAQANIDEATRNDDRMAETRADERTNGRVDGERVAEDRTDNRIPEDQAPVAARTRIFEDSDAEQYRAQWRELQAGFVDEPREAVREADALVTQMVETLTSQLNERKRALQGEWDSVDTEQLRVALQRYRSLFDQMVQI
ncbi:hypothetical protein KIPE111705_21545 [Kibdelosporangium persicum]|uniref:Uncharacterized protein n=1 Tax=Kibdelosporangium persicum TaxID=2698649 RepID=A0ABX2EVI1_9PSEU|nr:hypothetical protein [Kibdelosporangium persicum]NRN62958.1 hypothetical protein [Kibdelosporangium persicum]